MDCIVISSDVNRTTNKLLQDACTKRNVNFRQLDAAQADFTDLPSLAPGTLIYRAHVGGPYLTLERVLLNQDVVSFYSDPFHIVNHQYDPLTLLHADLPIPKTVFQINRAYVDDAVKSVGGYPVIIKSMGGSHGVGVMRLDSRESLVSVLDHLDQRGDYYIMRECIETDQSIRLTVLGDRVIDGIAYHVQQGDFRSNVGTPEVSPYGASNEMKQAAVKAVAAMGFEFGGVDFLTDDKGFYIAEVNFPCYFPRSQEITGVDIAGHMIDHLLAKSQKRYS